MMTKLIAFSFLCSALLVTKLVTANPEITAFDKIALLPESANVNTLLSTITCTDTDGDVTRTQIQTVNPSSPCTNCFEILDCGAAECLQYRSGVGALNYASTQSYLITVSCQDDIEPAATEVIQIIIEPNTPPYIDPDNLLVDNPISGTGSPAGTEIYDVNAIDDDNDEITYSMQVIPAAAAFGFTIDPGTGKITSTVDLRSVCVPHVTFIVRASDGKGTSRPLVINSVITNANIAPVAKNLNTVVQIPEDKTGTAYTMQFIDEDVNSLTYTTTTTNAAGFAQYSIIGTNTNIDVIADLDYEDAALRNTFVTVKASDGYCESPEYWLRLEVMDVNEPPIISPVRSMVTVCEGELEHDPGLTVEDPDGDDTQKWYFLGSFNNRKGRYDIDQDTGFLSTTLDYDVDPGIQGVMDEKWTHRIVMEDKGGLKDTVTVTVSYLDCNDNSPIFEGTTFDHRKNYVATECTAGGTILGRVDAVDIDSDFEGNNVITYSGGTGCCRVDESGRIIVDSVLPAGNVVSFDVYATDQGQNPRQLTSKVPAYVTVVFTECPTTTTPGPTTTTTTTPTTPTINITESFTNIPWIVLAALLALAFLGLLTYMLWRYGALCLKHPWCGKCKLRSRKRIPKPERPKTEPMRKPASRPNREDPVAEPEEMKDDAIHFHSFWKTRFRDDDAKAVPDLKAKPEPGDLEDIPMDPLQTDNNNTQAAPPADPKKKKCSIM